MTAMRYTLHTRCIVRPFTVKYLRLLLLHTLIVLSVHLTGEKTTIETFFYVQTSILLTVNSFMDAVDQ